MGYKATDGRAFNSPSQGKNYDKHLESKKSAPKHENEQGGGETENIHEVVAQHGAAHKIEIKHDHAAGKHSVTSHHEGGHVHNSEHGTAEEAHDEAKGAAGIGDEEPEPEGQESGEAMPDMSSMGI